MLSARSFSEADELAEAPNKFGPQPRCRKSILPHCEVSEMHDVRHAAEPKQSQLRYYGLLLDRLSGQWLSIRPAAARNDC
jgi:hypothetical protein